MSIASMSSTGSVTPNFGRETAAEKFAISVGGAIDPGTGAVFSELVNIPVDLGDFGPISAGAASGTSFSWDEVGILRLVPGTASGGYLGRTPVPGTAVNVGRFYPHHFDTAVDEPLPSLCPVTVACTYGSAYSGQPFSVEVTARNAGNVVTRNYQGRFARQVSLGAWSAAGGSTPSTPGGMVDPVVPASSFDNGIGTVTTPAYKFPTAFSSADADSTRRAADWITPTSIHLRASETAGDFVTSNQGATSVEGPIWIVSGRLMVANTYGSELLNLPVRVTAQYWTGTRWVNSITDNVSIVSLVNPSLASNLEVFGCIGSLATSCALSPYSTAPFTLASGVGTVRLLAPGAGKSGGARMRVNSPGWLPSTVGQLVFGKRRAPLDYIREVY